MNKSRKNINATLINLDPHWPETSGAIRYRPKIVKIKNNNPERSENFAIVNRDMTADDEEAVEFQELMPPLSPKQQVINSIRNSKIVMVCSKKPFFGLRGVTAPTTRNRSPNKGGDLYPV